MQAAWLLKCRCITEKAFVDDCDWDDGDLSAESLLDDHAMAQAPRPGTSLQRGSTAAASSSSSSSGMQSYRPMTQAGRPITGFARPGTMERGGAGGSLEARLRTGRATTAAARAGTALGRHVRLGTASLMATALGGTSGPFINADRLELRRYAGPGKGPIARALSDYLLYVDLNPGKALELLAAATQQAGYQEWWWKLQLGKAYYRLGLLRDSERQLKSALAQQVTVVAFLELSKVYLKLDQPQVALDILLQAQSFFPMDSRLPLAAARLRFQLGQLDLSAAMYKQVLVQDPSCIEAMASLAGNFFYADQPELGLRFYRRLLQMGLQGSCELWCNLGLSAFYASQWDLCLPCFQKALQTAPDAETAGAVWYNIGHLAIGLGDSSFAYQAFRVCTEADAANAEAFVNLGVLEMRQGDVAAAASNFATAQKLQEGLYEAWYNGALLAQRRGDVSAALQQVQRALKAYPEHEDSRELLRQLQQQTVSL